MWIGLIMGCELGCSLLLCEIRMIMVSIFFALRIREDCALHGQVGRFVRIQNRILFRYDHGLFKGLEVVSSTLLLTRLVIKRPKLHILPLEPFLDISSFTLSGRVFCFEIVVPADLFFDGRLRSRCCCSRRCLPLRRWLTAIFDKLGFNWWFFSV